MAVSDLVGILGDLSNCNDKVRCLEELKSFISSLSEAELREAVANIFISPVLHCLNTDDKEQLELCTVVLSQMLPAMSSGMLLDNLKEQSQDWLNHGIQPLLELCLSQLGAISADIPDAVCQCVHLLVGTANHLGSKCDHIASKASKVFRTLAGSCSSVGLRTVLSGEVYRALHDVSLASDAVRYRVLQLSVDIAVISPDCLAACCDCGLMEQLLMELQTSDILLQLNCLELLSDLATAPHGLSYLDQRGTVRHLEEMIALSCESSKDGLLLSGLLKFFGCIARFHPKEVLSHVHVFACILFDSITGKMYTSVRGLAIDTVGFIGSTPEGKAALGKHGNRMAECMQSMGEAMTSSSDAVSHRALVAVDSLMTIEVCDQADDLLHLTESWFHRLGSDPFNALWSIAKQPFAEKRLLSLKVLLSLALLPWGQRLMNGIAGFREYLLDRRSETSKVCKETKFDIVTVLVGSPTAEGVFGSAYCTQMKQFYLQGPFFVETRSEIAFEEES